MIFMFFAIAVFFVALLALIVKSGVSNDEAVRRAGKRGEEYASAYIKKILNEDDHLINNVCLSIEGKETELDNVVVNRYGVFIIEVKNYVGRLSGSEDDYEWTKYKTTDAGNVYGKTVKNPIKQVKRQIYILAHVLKAYGINVWVDGFAFFVNNNSPVISKNVLRNLNDMDRALHDYSEYQLSEAQVMKICEILTGKEQ